MVNTFDADPFSVIVQKVSPSTPNNLIQSVILSPIKNTYFPWLCLLLLVSSDNIRRPLVYFAIAHWTINTIGDILYQTIYLYKPEVPMFPFSNHGYICAIGASSVFFLLSEILGDWYLLVRTKVLIRNNKKGLISLFVVCILFNLSKVAEMIVYLRYVPFTSDPKILSDPKALEEQYNRDFGTVIDQRLNVYIFQQIFSLIYDILVIVILKRNVFVKNEIGLSNNTFLYKFKQLSEYRIYLGVAIAIVCAPFIFTEILLLRNSQQNYYNEIYTIRSKLLNFFYVFMYIDQISLKFFVNKTNVVRSTYKSNNSTTSKTNHTIYTNNNNNSSSNTSISYNKSNNTSFNTFSNGAYNNLLGSYNSNGSSEFINYDYNSNNQNANAPTYRYNNYNIVKNFNNNSSSNLFSNNTTNNNNNIFSNNTSNNNNNMYSSNSSSNPNISDIFYNKILYQNQMDSNDDNRYLIDKNYHYQFNKFH